MTTSYQPHEPSENSRALHSESVLEIARIAVRGKLISEAMGGPLSEQSQAARSTFHDILDLACGYGNWILEVARLLPLAQVTGVDISEAMLEGARTAAQAQGLTNAHFVAMNILKSLAFSEDSFDLINARHLGAIMTPITWSILLRQTMRVCRPGGVMRLTESEMPMTNSKVVFQQGKDFITRLGLAGSEQYDETYGHFLSEMQSADFSAICYMLTAWGIKP